jgi:hypothetical protein
MLEDIKERLEPILRAELNSMGLPHIYFVVMLWPLHNQICFRLSDAQTKNGSDWSNWLSEEEVQINNLNAISDEVKKLVAQLNQAYPAS